MGSRRPARVVLTALAAFAMGCAPASSTPGGSASRGSSGGDACAPGTTAPCYTGPSGTENVGTCRPGLATCDAAGDGYGACVGEVLPAPDVCVERRDTSCRGVLEACSLAYVWAGAYGIAGSLNVGNAVATDAAGNVVITGVIDTAVDFGKGELVASGLNTMFVARFAADGTPLWSRRYGGDATSTQRGNAVAVDASGNIYVTGAFGGVVDFGSGYTLTSAGGLDVVLLKLDPDGNTVWAQSGGSIGDQEGQQIAVTPLGDVVIAGTFDSDFGFDRSTPFLGSAGQSNIFWATFESTGGYVAGGNTTGGDQTVEALAVDAAGRGVLGGGFVSSIAVGAASADAIGVADAFLLTIDAPSGDVRWLRTYGSVGALDAVSGVDFDPAGDVVVAGAFGGTITLEATSLIALGQESLFLAKLDGDANTIWASAYGVGVPQLEGASVKVGSDGHVAMGGFFSQLLSFSDATLLAQAGPEGASAFVATFDANGVPLASKAFGDDGVAAVLGIAISADGFVYVTGGEVGTIDFGGGTIGVSDPSAPVASPFLAKFAP